MKKKKQIFLYCQYEYENKKIKQKGQIVVYALVFGFIALLIVGGLVSWVNFNIRASKQSANRELAIQIAEAGIDYYRWHLAHAPTDFQDGTEKPGPYIHDFYDKNGNIIGQFILDITPPPLGSSVVTLKSTGKIKTDPYISRSIVVRLTKPSFAEYAVAANTNMRFGEGTEVFGPIHANGGIRFDGIAHNIVTSAMATYDDPDHEGPNEFGVHTHIPPSDPLPPNPVPDRSDIFRAGRQFPVPAVDFTGISNTLAQIKTEAMQNGRYFASSDGLGYHIVLKTNDTFDLYRVLSLIEKPNKWCSCPLDSEGNCSQDGWGTWSIKKEQLINNYSFPLNGFIFLEDNVWVSGKINTARLTIVSAKFPESPATDTSITVNEDLLYTNYNGQDVIALIAQKNFNIGLYSANKLRIDAALVAKNGRVGRYYYNSFCGDNRTRQSITLYGVIITNQRYGFAYTDNSGYRTRNIIYDENLLYNPPPNFPLTTNQYQILSWEEVK